MRAFSQVESSASVGISAVQIVGQPILVFDHVADKAAPNHLPDLPSTAWKEADGTVNVTVPHFENHRMRGPDLESVTSDPHAIFDSAIGASDVIESHYNYHHWLSSPYTFDGRSIYALAHTEWYACELVGDCGFSTPTQYSTGNDWLNSWANTVTAMVSRDGGASWAMNGLNEAHVVSNESFTWTGSPELAQRIYHVALNHSGMMTPSRLVREGSYYYSIGFLNHRDFTKIDPVTHVAPIDKYDWVLMRTTDPRQPAGWEGWVSGSNYTPLGTHAFSAFSPKSGELFLNAGEPQIIFDANAQLYIAIFVVWGNPGAVYYMTTPSLAQPVWSDAQAVGGSAALQTNPRNPANCSVGFVVNDYVSLMDRHSDGYNFELTDGDPWLFYVYNPANTCGGDNLARDLYRVRLNVVYTAGARPSVSTQPASMSVEAGQPSAFVIAAGGATSYQWQVSTDHGISWSNVADGATYTGSTTTTLAIPHTTPALGGTQYRCIATNAGINAISNAATLRINSSVVLDFGPQYGIWVKHGAAWGQLNPFSAKAMVRIRRGDHDGIVFDFGAGVGVWYWERAGAGNDVWVQLHSQSPTAMVGLDRDGNGDVDAGVFTFAGQGVWLYDFEARQWTQIHSLDASQLAAGDLDGDGDDDLILDFSGYGLWVRYGNATWAQVSPSDVTTLVVADLDGNGRSDLIMNFPGYGLWAYRNGTTWSQVHPFAATRLAAGDLDGNGVADLIIDFGASYGVWTLKNGTTWAQLHTLTSEGITSGDMNGNGHDEVIVDFGSAGVWSYEDLTGWQQVTPLNATAVAAGRFY